MKYKTIELNGKDYIELEALDELQKEYDALKKESKINLTLKEFKVFTLDEANVLGLGSGEVVDGWIGIKVSINYLEKALKIIKTLNEGKNPSVTLAWANDQPLVIGNFKEIKSVNDKQSKEWSGVILAPRS